MGGKNKKLENIYLRLKWVSTIIRGIKTEDIKDLFESEWNLLEASANDFNDAEDMLNDPGLLKKIESNKYEIEVIFPDLIGEYFVLKQLYNMKDEDIRDKLAIIWDNKPNIAFSFFTNLLLDFSYLMGTTQIELKKWNLVTYSNIDKENLVMY